MSISQPKREVLLVLLGAVSYYWIVVLFLRIATSVPMPGWLSNHFGSYVILMWLHFLHGMGLALGSVPFVSSIHSLQPRRPVLAAVAVAFLGLVVPLVAPYAARLPDASLHSQVSAAIDILKFAGTLPLLTWLVIRKAAADNSLKPTLLRGPA